MSLRIDNKVVKLSKYHANLVARDTLSDEIYLFQVEIKEREGGFTRAPVLGKIKARIPLEIRSPYVSRYSPPHRFGNFIITYDHAYNEWRLYQPPVKPTNPVEVNGKSIEELYPTIDTGKIKIQPTYYSLKNGDRLSVGNIEFYFYE